MFKSAAFVAASLALGSISASFGNDQEAGGRSCHGLKTYDISRSLSIYREETPKTLAETSQFETILDTKLAYFTDNDGSWGIKLDSLMEDLPTDYIYFHCAPGRREKCPRKIVSRLWGLVFKISEMRLIKADKNRSFELEMEVITSYSLTKIARGVLKFWLKRNPETDCLVAFAQDMSQEHQPLVPFNFGIFSAKKKSGVKRVSVWDVDPSELFKKPYSDIRSYRYLGDQAIE